MALRISSWPLLPFLLSWAGTVPHSLEGTMSPGSTWPFFEDKA